MRERSDHVHHAELVASVAHGDRDHPAVRPLICQSWRRCVNVYHLDPVHGRETRVVEHDNLRERRDQLGDVLRIARVEMGSLHRQVSGTGYGIVLTDADGVIVSYLGDPAFSRLAHQKGLREGAVWSEQEQGTNGMGTCLMAQRPTFIHRDDHFLVRNMALTCAAAPIFDPQGRLAAALDMSGHAETAQQHALALVSMCAQNIENRALLYAFRNDFILRFHSQQAFISTPGEGTVAFDGDGRILAANHSALAQLALDSVEAIVGKSMEEVFDVRLGELLARGQSNPFRAQSLRGQTGERPYFGIVQTPWSARVPPPRTTGSGAAEKRPPRDPLDEMEFGDDAMARNVRAVRRVIERDIPILLLGETGTGKGLFARAIHRTGQRASGPFVAVNCAAIPESLIESELFGYRPGAFTGAGRGGHVGKIAQASGGTLFLDEIGDMPLPLQAHLLNVLEEREVVPLGGEKAIPVDIQIISATHRDLAELVVNGLFRDDLYYRLKGVALTLPPLRSRQDKHALIRWSIEQESDPQDRINADEALVKALAGHAWPGNIRQLRSVLRTMLALRMSDRLSLSDLPEELRHAGLQAASPPPAAPGPGAEGTDNPLVSAEREALLRVLDETRWNISDAARRLQLSRKTMYRKMLRHGVTRPL